MPGALGTVNKPITITGTGLTAEVELGGYFNLSLAGGAGTVKLEKSYDGGSTWFDVSIDTAGTPASYTLSAGQEMSLVGFEPMENVRYRLNCTQFTSNMNAVFAQ